MSALTQKEADAYDRIIEAAADLADLIMLGGIEIDEYALEELSIFLVQNAEKIKHILKPIARKPK